MAIYAEGIQQKIHPHDSFQVAVLSRGGRNAPPSSVLSLIRPYCYGCMLRVSPLPKGPMGSPYRPLTYLWPRLRLSAVSA